MQHNNNKPELIDGSPLDADAHEQIHQEVNLTQCWRCRYHATRQNNQTGKTRWCDYHKKPLLQCWDCPGPDRIVHGRKDEPAGIPELPRDPLESLRANQRSRERAQDPF